MACATLFEIPVSSITLLLLSNSNGNSGGGDEVVGAAKTGEEFVQVFSGLI